MEGDSTQRQIASKQGSVLLYNATIENARDAIFTKGATLYTLFTKSGGIVQVNNTLFHNNLRSVGFIDYENHKVNGDVTNNVSYFTRCTFVVDDDNLFAANNDDFEYHLSMCGVRGVKFNGCDFRNEVTTTTDSARGKAVYSEGAGFMAKRVCPSDVNSLDPCFCEGTAPTPSPAARSQVFSRPSTPPTPTGAMASPSTTATSARTRPGWSLPPPTTPRSASATSTCRIRSLTAG